MLLLVINVVRSGFYRYIMKHFLFSILIVVMSVGNLYSQKHDYNWVMGYEYDGPEPFGNVRIDFNYQPPKVFKENLKMNFQSCGGSCSDSLGNLLFYTNGIRIFNKEHQLIENGDAINPGSVWNNSQLDGYVTTLPVVGLPLPKSDNIYYLLHTDVKNGGSVPPSYTSNFYYSIIDMKANGGLGKVLVKNQVLLEGEIMWPAFVKHANGRDWWIMGMKRADTKHYLFLLSPTGISGPYVQDIGPPFNETEYEGESLFSENGELFLRHDSKTALRLYDFDRCSGQLSNLRIVPFQGDAYQHSFYAAFSPNSRFLYVSRPGSVWSLDLQATNLSASYDTVANWELNYYPNYPWATAYGLNQLGPDGKIYWSNWTGSSQAMNVMNYPNLPGDAADCEEEAFYLPRWNSLTINQFPNYRLGEWDGSPCDTLNAQKPGDGFVATLYNAAEIRRDTTYTILPPIPGAKCADCTPRDLELLNNPMAYIHAMMVLRETGKPPADWPTEKAEREGMFLVLPPKK